jgi:hypothetical protein
VIVAFVSQHTSCDETMDKDSMNEFLEALGAISSPHALPFNYSPIDPAEIMLTQWKPYHMSKTVEATLEDFPEKLKVGM